MSLPVATAVTGSSWEASLVAALEHEPLGITVVRRCIDVAELLATASTGVVRAVLVASDLRRLDREAVARLAAAGVGVVGVHAPGDDAAAAHLQALGVGIVVPADSSTGTIAQAVLESVAAVAPAHGTASLQYSQPLGALRVVDQVVDQVVDGPGDRPAPPTIAPALRRGRLVAVWGPVGAPGRTSVAVNLAAEIAALDQPVVLADGDTYGASIAQQLGLLDESAGLAAAARVANGGRLDLVQLARAAVVVLPNLRVLTGLPRPERWSELRPAALEVVWERCRELAEITVVDVGFCLEQQEELSFDVAAPRRNGAALTTLARADTVVAVGSADPVGVQRLIRGLSELRAAVPGAELVVVVNRVRSAVVGPEPERQLEQVLHRHAGISAVRFVPDDPATFDPALREARTLAERSPSSPARQVISALARELAGLEPARVAGLRRHSARRRGRLARQRA